MVFVGVNIVHAKLSVWNNMIIASFHCQIVLLSYMNRVDNRMWKNYNSHNKHEELEIFFNINKRLLGVKKHYVNSK